MAPISLLCDNCGAPMSEHCKRHLVPCCPGRCSRLEELQAAGEQDDGALEAYVATHGED